KLELGSNNETQLTRQLVLSLMAPSLAEWLITGYDMRAMARRSPTSKAESPQGVFRAAAYCPATSALTTRPQRGPPGPRMACGMPYGSKRGREGTRHHPVSGALGLCRDVIAPAPGWIRAQAAILQPMW